MFEERRPDMTGKAKNVSKPDKALTLLQQAHDILTGIGGKEAAVWEVIAGRVQTTIGYVEKYK